MYSQPIHRVLTALIGYIAWEYPTNVLLQRLPLGKYSAGCITIWGLVLCCFAAVKNFPGAVAIRFLCVIPNTYKIYVMVDR